MQPCVYILASDKNGNLYTGVTSDLVRRIWEHKKSSAEGFTRRYKVHALVWYEQYETMEAPRTAAWMENILYFLLLGFLDN